MKKLVVVTLIAAVLSWAAFTPTAFSTADISKKEGKKCTYCHEKAGSKELNDTGKCYKKDKSLDKCKAPEEKKDK